MSVLVAAQYFAHGSGGIADVARLSASALLARADTSALACMEASDFTSEGVPVRGFAGARTRFLASLAWRARRASHVLFDFAGTARAQPLLLGSRARTALWVHGCEAWRDPPAKYVNAIRRADLLLVNSLHTRTRAAAAIGESRDVRICALATASDESPAHIGPSDGPPVVLLLGRIDEALAKGHDVLVDIWPKIAEAVPGARLVFAGGGTRVEAVRALASASPAAASIEVLGHVAEADLDALWRRASLFAMPGFEEGFGLVYAESMRRGLPVIASLEDAGQEVNEDGVTGHNISIRAKAEMTDAIVALLRDPDRARAMGLAGNARWARLYRRSCFNERFLAATQEFLAG